MAIYADPGFRDAFKEELKQGASGPAWRRTSIVVSVENPELKKYEGRTVGEIAEERGAGSRTTRSSISRSRTTSRSSSSCRAPTPTRRQLAEMLSDSRTLIGLSDAGAHLDMLCESRLSHLPARSLGAREARAHARARDPAHHVRAGGLLRLQGPRAAEDRRARPTS